jgi:TetR/AcrR family transcriptional regulator, cholesterol catabolism regulator
MGAVSSMALPSNPVTKPTKPPFRPAERAKPSKAKPSEAPAPTLKPKAKPKTKPTAKPEAGSQASDIGRRRGKALKKGSAAYQERRNEIANAAALVFNKKGYSNTSLADIAEAMGMDRATIYYYVSNKQELFDEVVREVSERNIAAAEAAKASTHSPLEKLRTVVTELMNSYAATYPLLYVYLRENLNHVEAERTEWSVSMRGLSHRFEDAVIAIVQEGIDDGSIRPLASARVLAFGVLGMVGWTNRWFVPDRSPENAEVIGNAFAEIALKGLAF